MQTRAYFFGRNRLETQNQGEKGTLQGFYKGKKNLFMCFLNG